MRAGRACRVPGTFAAASAYRVGDANVGATCKVASRPLWLPVAAVRRVAAIWVSRHRRWAVGFPSRRRAVGFASRRRAMGFPSCRRALKYPSEWPRASAGLDGRGGFRFATGWSAVVPGIFAAASAYRVGDANVGATCKVASRHLWLPVAAVRCVAGRWVSRRVAAIWVSVCAGRRVARHGRRAMGFASCRRAMGFPSCRRAMNYPSEWPRASAGVGIGVATGWFAVVPGIFAAARDYCGSGPNVGATCMPKRWGNLQGRIATLVVARCRRSPCRRAMNYPSEWPPSSAEKPEVGFVVHGASLVRRTRNRRRGLLIRAGHVNAPGRTTLLAGTPTAAGFGTPPPPGCCSGDPPGGRPPCRPGC